MYPSGRHPLGTKNHKIDRKIKQKMYWFKKKSRCARSPCQWYLYRLGCFRREAATFFEGCFRREAAKKNDVFFSPELKSKIKNTAVSTTKVSLFVNNSVSAGCELRWRMTLGGLVRRGTGFRPFLFYGFLRFLLRKRIHFFYVFFQRRFLENTV